MRKRRIISCIVSLALSINYSSSLSIPVKSYADTNKVVGDIIDPCENPYVGSEHAYDPLAEFETAEAEKRFRQTADIEENRIIFSIIDYRSGDDIIAYLDNESEICKNYMFNNISMVYETVKSAYSDQDYNAYEVFYEADISSDDVWGVVDKLHEDERILSAEPVFVWKKAAIGDPIEVSDEEYKRANHFPQLEVKKVWQGLKNSDVPGKGTIIAVIDTGVDYNHKDLADNIWTNPGEIAGNGIDDDQNGYIDDVHGINVITGSGDPMDDHGHGTHVAGAIAMTAGNGGGVGLAYGTKIMCIKAGSSDGTFGSSDIVRAVKYAIDNGADVINMSFGGEEKSAMVEAALKDAAEDAVLVASAGNDGLPTSEAAEKGYKNYKDVYPAGYNTVIGVMASDNDDHLASFSNWDYVPGKGCEYEMAAPGTDIYSTLPGNRYAIWSGTSLGAANVSAAAAIIRSEYPDKSKYNSRFIMGQLINASSSKATAEPDIITTSVVTTASTTTSDSVTTISTTTVMSDDPLVNADVDGKEGIDKDDFKYLLKGIVGINELSGSKGDVNCDGTADMFDAVSILKLYNDSDSVKDIMASAAIRKEFISFDIPKIDISEDGDYTSYTFTYNSSYPFKAITGQLKYNGKEYSGEFKEVKLLDSTSGDIIYEFNPKNGKFAAYCADNETNGSFTVSVYEGKDGSYSIDTNSLKFYDENGKEYFGYNLGNFVPELNYNTATQTVAAVGNPSAVAVYDKYVEYPRLNIIDSLTVKPHPDLRIESVEMLETEDIDKANNGDGIVQPGETVGLGISIWNSWAAASDVKVKIEAVGADGKANPYVEILDNNVDFGNIGTFSGSDNGLTYNGANIKSITAPIRIKIKDDAPNDGKMELRITMTAENGFDIDDKAVYTDISGYSFAVQRISYLSGTIKKDITLDRSRFWIIDGNLKLNDDVIMTIKPGTQISLNGSISGYGRIICKGTESFPISIIGNDSGYGYINTRTDATYTNFISLSEFINLSANHCKIIFGNGDKRMIESSSFCNSIICDVSYSYDYWKDYSYIISSNATNCLFNLIDRVDSNVGHNNVYISKESILFSIDLKADSNANAILFNENQSVNIFQMCVNEIRNYYGTDNPQFGEDYNEEDLKLLSSDSYLTLDSPEIESIYPFMTEAYVTNENGERIENAYPGQKLMVHVKFNRDMATDIQPEVSLESGYCSEPYKYKDEKDEVIDSYSIYSLTGNWISSREWVGKYTFDLNVLDKKELNIMPEVGEYKGGEYFKSRFFTIRSEGAVAADDRWLVTGNDGGRFGINVVKPATIQSYTLIGEGVSGGNKLTLTQGVTQTVAGYNLYRSIGDSNVYLKINKSLISNEDLQYVDNDVITGQKYYYYFTSVDTDFNESKPSNIVECVPLEIKKPVINKVTVTGTKTGDDIKITADVDNDTYFKNMTLYYKYDASYTWNVINMQNNGSYVYEAVIPSDKVKEGNLEYYIEAFDSFNKANYGSRSNPCIIKISSSGIITQITTTIATTTTTTTTTTVDAPKILNLFIPEAKANETIKAYAEIYGSGDINAVLKYKYADENKWKSVPMQNMSTWEYYAIIPSDDSRQGTLQYYLEVSDGNNTSYFGNSEKYFNIKVDAASSTTTSTTTTTTTTSTTTSTTTTTTTPSTTTSTTTTTTTTTSTTTSTTTTTTTTSKTTSTTTTTTTTTSTTTSTTTTTTTTTSTTTSTTTTTTTTTSTTTSTTTTTTTTSKTTSTTTTTTTIPLSLEVTSISIKNGEQYKIPLDRGDLTFKSSNTDVVVVSGDGTVTAIGAGDAVITIIDKNYNVVQLKITVNANETSKTEYALGDVNNSGIIDAVDASAVLKYYARISTNQEGGFTEKQELAADVNSDGIIDSVDASRILAYYAYVSTTNEEAKSMEEFMKKKTK